MFGNSDFKTKREKKKRKVDKRKRIKREVGESRIESVCAAQKTASPSDVLRIDWTAFIRFFNDTLQRHGSNISPIAFLSKGKKSRVQALVNQWGTKKVLVVAVDRMARSDFLNGRCPKYRFIGSFHWLTSNNEIFEKVLNGYYDNPPPQELTPEEQRQLELERYKAREAERRAEARRIEEEEHERMAREREERAKHCVSYEEYQRMKKTHPALVGTPPVMEGRPAESGK